MHRKTIQIRFLGRIVLEAIGNLFLYVGVLINSIPLLIFIYLILFVRER